MAQLNLTVDAAEMEAVLDAPWDIPETMSATAAAVDAMSEFPVPDPIKEAFWKWYESHKEDVILKKRILFFKVELKVKHLKFIFEKFFGPQP